MLKRIRQAIFQQGERKQRRERGLQLAEMAIAMPMMMAVMGLTTEFARYFYSYTTLNKATRLGARYLSTQIYNTDSVTATKNLVVCGKTTSCASNEAILRNLTASNVEITTTGTTTGTSNLGLQTVTVKIVNYDHSPMFTMQYKSIVNNTEVTNTVGAIGLKPSTTVRYIREN